MRRAAVVLGLALLASSAGQLQSASSADNVETAILDRTFTCSTALIGGIRQAKVRARRGSGAKAGAWSRPALAGLSTSIAGSAERAIYDQIAWVTAGLPAKTSTVVDVFAPGYEFPMQNWGTVGVNAAQCRPSSARVALDHRGLETRDVGPFDDAYDCASPRVLVRVRAELGSPSSLTSFRGFLRTTTPVRRASLVVRTSTGKALAYSEVADSGKTRLFIAPNCYPD